MKRRAFALFSQSVIQHQRRSPVEFRRATRMLPTRHIRALEMPLSDVSSSATDRLTGHSICSGPRLLQSSPRSLVPGTNIGSRRRRRRRAREARSRRRCRRGSYRRGPSRGRGRLRRARIRSGNPVTDHIPLKRRVIQYRTMAGLENQNVRRTPAIEHELFFAE